MEHTTIAVDLAKSVFQVAISHRAGRIDREKRLSRDRFLPYLAQQPPATVLLEECGSSHHWARQLEQFGHVVRLLPAHDVHRYVRRNTTDRTDAKALLEAARNDEIHPVPVKSVEHQAIPVWRASDGMILTVENDGAIDPEWSALSVESFTEECVPFCSLTIRRAQALRGWPRLVS